MEYSYKSNDINHSKIYFPFHQSASFILTYCVPSIQTTLQTDEVKNVPCGTRSVQLCLFSGISQLILKIFISKHWNLINYSAHFGVHNDISFITEC